jgi:hypothetical protein
MLTPDFIRHEIDAINEKWREIQKGASVRAKGWRSFTDSTERFSFTLDSVAQRS